MYFFLQIIIYTQCVSAVQMYTNSKDLYNVFFKNVLKNLIL